MDTHFKPRRTNLRAIMAASVFAVDGLFNFGPTHFVVATAGTEKTVKIKFLHGKRKDKVEDVETVQAKSFIDDGMAEEVPVEQDSIEKALADLEGRATKTIDAVLNAAVDKALKNLAKGLNKQSVVIKPDNDLADEGQGVFKSMSHFLVELKRSGQECQQPTATMKTWIDRFDKQQKTAYVPTGNTEGASPFSSGTSDAGPAVPVVYQTDIFRMYGEQMDLMSRCFPVPMTTNYTKIPILRNYNRANTTATAGIVPTVPGEATAISPSMTNWEQLALNLANEKIVVPVSNELLDDNNVALGNVVAGQAIWQLRKTINGGIIKGAGNGASGSTNLASPCCTGIIGNGATKVITRATSGTITFADIMGMYAGFAFDDADYGNAVWLAHPTALPIIAGITSGNYNVFTAPGGLQELSVARLMGRPIISTGWCNPVGTVGAGFQDSGDLILFDPMKYVIGYKGGINTFVSPHVFAVSDQTGFRFTQRLCGKPGLSGVITLEDGSTTVSPFVQLGQNASSS